jgi:hypothetical protein
MDKGLAIYRRVPWPSGNRFPVPLAGESRSSDRQKQFSQGHQTLGQDFALLLVPDDDGHISGGGN